LAFAQDDEQALQDAITSYHNEDYKNAILTFKKLEKKGFASDELFFNLATSYFKNDRLAEAVLYYEKALKLNPRHNPSKKNLTLLNEMRASDISLIPDFFLLQWWRSFHNFLPSGLWLILSFLFLGGALYLFYLWLFKKPGLRIITISMLCLCVGMILLLAARGSFLLTHEFQYAVNIEKASLHSGPNAASDIDLEIISGEKLEIVDRLGEWYQVRLINKELGWIKSDIVKEI